MKKKVYTFNWQIYFSLKLFLIANLSVLWREKSTLFLLCIFLHLPSTPFLSSTCFRSDVRKTREPRVSICRERLRATCIDQTTRTFSLVRLIEPDRSVNPKYDYDTFLSILSCDRMIIIKSILRSYDQDIRMSRIFIFFSFSLEK